MPLPLNINKCLNKEQKILKCYNLTDYRNKQKINKKVTLYPLRKILYQGSSEEGSQVQYGTSGWRWLVALHSFLGHCISCKKTDSLSWMVHIPYNTEIYVKSSKIDNLQENQQFMKTNHCWSHLQQFVSINS